MTVSSLIRKLQFTGDSTNSALPITYDFFLSTDLVVVQKITATDAETTLTLTTHYTVTGGSGTTGTVVPVDGATDFTSAMTWTVSRVLPQTQLTDWVNADSFPSDTHEAAADRVVMLAQEVSEEVGRALQYPTTDVAGKSNVLPSIASRASKYLGFDSDSEPIALAAPTDTALTTSFSESLLDDANSATARATLDTFEDVFINRGDLLRAGASGAEERFALGTSGYVLSSDGIDALWVASTTLVAPMSRGLLQGMAVSRASATSLSVAEGICRTGTSADQSLGNYTNTGAFAKTFNHASGEWVAGTGNNGVPAGIIAMSAAVQTVHFFALMSTGTPATGAGFEFGYDTSLTAATLLATSAVTTELPGTIYFRRILSFVTDATPEIPDRKTHGDTTLLVTPVLDASISGDFSAGQDIVLDSLPTGIVVEALLNVMTKNTANSGAPYLHSKDHTDAAGSVTAAPLANLAATSASEHFSHLSVLTDTAAKIIFRSGDTTTELRIATYGFIDRRGRDD